MKSNDKLAKPIIDYLVSMSKENVVKSFVLQKQNLSRTSESNRLILNDTE